MRDAGRHNWTYYRPEDAAPPEVIVPTFDALADPQVGDLVSGGLALLPRGAAWGSPDGQAPEASTNLARLVSVFLGLFVGLYARAFGLSTESRALTTTELLADWERDFGLPGKCRPLGQTVEARKGALVDKARNDGVISPLDFVRLAKGAGYDVAIEERFMFRCGYSRCGAAHVTGDFGQEAYWIVHVYGLDKEYFRVGRSRTGRDPLFAVPTARTLVCLFEQYAPGWTKPIYRFHDGPYPAV